jgi:hypothetical protein
MGISIPANKYISKFLSEIKFGTTFTPKIIKHITAILTAMAIKGFTAKMIDMEEVSEYHRTTISRFLSDDRWDDEPIKLFIKQRSFKHIQRLSKKNDTPIFISFDDTVNVKTKPSSQVSRPIEMAEYHHSHLLRKQVWGHQVMAAMIHSGQTALNYDIKRYDKSKQSKIEYVLELIKELPCPETKAYFMTDSWYTNSKVIDACASKGYYFIGAMKSNRIIYPQGIRISVNEFAANYIEKNDVDLVTVNGANYYVYRHEGKLNGVDNAVVLICWPETAFKNPQALKAFICTDTSLENNTILEYYTQRWCIETFFSQSKDSLGLAKYQIRSIKGIERLWLLMSLFHLLCTTGLKNNMAFGDGLHFLRQDIKRERIAFIYQCAQRRIPIEEIYTLCA